MFDNEIPRMADNVKADGQMAFRVSKALKQDFTQMAETEGKKPSQLIIELMTEYLKRRKENYLDIEDLKALLDKHDQEISQLKQQQNEFVKKSSA